MNHKRFGFSLVELIIVIVVIGILTAVVYVSYGGIVAAAKAGVAKSNLSSIAEAMELERIQTGTYPTTVPDSVKLPSDMSFTVAGASDNNVSSDAVTYSSLSPVQNGVLLSTVCQQLIDAGAGKGTDKGGNVQNYITGCGNWSRGSIQVTAWDTKVWNTPVNSSQLTDYANNFTTSDTWNAAQITTVKNFYNQLVQTFQDEGGTFPITSFWDSWATSTNGGVMYQDLPAPTPAPASNSDSYCVEAKYKNSTWHIDQDRTVKDGGC